MQKQHALNWLFLLRWYDSRLLSKVGPPRIISKKVQNDGNPGSCTDQRLYLISASKYTLLNPKSQKRIFIVKAYVLLI